MKNYALFAKIIVAGIGISGMVRYGNDALSAQNLKTQWDGIYTEAQTKRGEALYQERCANCHGPNLAGGDMNPPLSGPTFSANWDGVSLGDLFDRIRTTMPQDAPGSLNRQMCADILAFILLNGEAPVGQTELPTLAQELKEIKYQAIKP